MRRIVFLLSLIAGLAVAAPAFSQAKPGTVARVFVTQAKPGMTQQYEEGRKRHMNFHRQQNDTWTWETWQVETGPAAGTYVTVTAGHEWKDFDAWDAKMGKADDADAMTNLVPYAASQTNSFEVFLPEASRPPQAQEPSKMVEVIHYMVKQGSGQDFEQAITKIHQAIIKVNWQPNQPYMWFSVANGGSHPHYLLVVPHNSWAEMATPEVTFEAMLEQAVGQEQARSLMRTLDNSTERVSSEMLVYRPDLSYRPASQ